MCQLCDFCPWPLEDARVLSYRWGHGQLSLPHFSILSPYTKTINSTPLKINPVWTSTPINQTPDTPPSLTDLPVVEIEPGHVIYAAGPDFPIRYENNEPLAALTPVQGVARYSNGAHQPADGHALPLIEDECSLSVPHVHLSFPYCGAVVVKDLACTLPIWDASEHGTPEAQQALANAVQHWNQGFDVMYDRTPGNHHPDDDLENIAYPVIAHAYQAFGLNLQDAIDDSWSATDSEENIEKFKGVFRGTVGC